MLIRDARQVRLLEQKIIAAAAIKRGFTVHMRQKYLYVTGNGVGPHKFLKGWTSAQGQFTRLFRNKQATKDVLKAFGASVPEGALFHAHEAERALDYAGYLGWPVVLKPDTGNKGRHVYVNISDAATFRNRFSTIAGTTQTVVVEKMVPYSTEYRFFYLDKKIVSIIRRIPANVTGDGKSTIDALVGTKNTLRKARGNGRYGRFPMIVLDEESRALLSERGLTPNSVLPAGETLHLRKIGNLSAGGDTISVMAEFHPSYAERMEAIFRNLPGCLLLGLDVFVRDHSQPCDESNYTIIEVNPAPGYRMHVYPWQGEAVDLGGLIVDAIFPDRPSVAPRNAPVSRSQFLHVIKKALLRRFRMNRHMR